MHIGITVNMQAMLSEWGRLKRYSDQCERFSRRQILAYFSDFAENHKGTTKHRVTPQYPKY